MTKNKPKKKKINVQRETSDNEVSESEDSSEETVKEDVIVPCSGAHTLDWSGVHLRPNGNVSKCTTQIKKAKFTGVHGVQNPQKMKVNHQMNDLIFLDSTSQVTIFK